MVVLDGAHRVRVRVRNWYLPLYREGLSPLYSRDDLFGSSNNLRILLYLVVGWGVMAVVR